MNIPKTGSPQAQYEKYRLQWMLDHNHTLSELIDELQKLRDESDPNMSLQSVFKDWEFGYGFGSEIWPCFEEFLDCEYQEKNAQEVRNIRGRANKENRRGASKNGASR